MCQAEMVSKAQRTVTLDSREAWVLSLLLEPQANVKPAFPHHNIGKTHASLDHNATLLGINGDLPVFASHFDKAIECFPQMALLSFEVNGNAVAPA